MILYCHHNYLSLKSCGINYPRNWQKETREHEGREEGGGRTEEEGGRRDDGEVGVGRGEGGYD